MNKNKCVICERNADLSVPIIKTMEITVGYDSKWTFGGSKSVTSFAYPSVNEETAGVCRYCMKNNQNRSILLNILAMIVSTGIFGFIFTFVVFLFDEIFNNVNILAKNHFLYGLFSALIFVFVIFIFSALKDRKKTKADKEFELAAGTLCNFLNMNRRPADYRYFTTSEWKKMQRTGKHPDSE